jgi:clathrin heavy chain
VRGGEFRLAGICGLQILRHPDHLEELIQHYERAGHHTELIQLMEQGLGLEEAHSGVFTELAILYSKYNPDKLMNHLKTFWNRMNTNKVYYIAYIIAYCYLHTEYCYQCSVHVCGCFCSEGYVQCG